MGYDLHKIFGDVEPYWNLLDTIVALLTCFGCVALFLICLTWWWKLLRSPTTDMCWWFFGTAILALALWSWSVKGLRLSLDPGRGLPDDTLYERIGVGLAVWIKLWIATRRKPMPRWRNRPAA